MKKKSYKVNGILHREDGPAIVLEDGSQCWYVNGLKHRINGPAVSMADGSQYWYLNDLLHRVGGPAMDLANGIRYWYFNGLKHRVDGPAVEKPSGKQYWILGVELSKETFDKLAYEIQKSKLSKISQQRSSVIVERNEKESNSKSKPLKETSHEDDPFEQKLDDDFEQFFNPKKEKQEQSTIDKKVKYSQGTDLSDFSEAQNFFGYLQNLVGIFI